MLSDLSVFNLLAVALYLLVAVSALAAGGTGMLLRQAHWHWQVWVTIGLLFVALATLRGLGLEDQWQDAMRASLRAEGTYAERRDLQRPIAAVLIALAGAIAFFIVYRGFSRVRGRRNVAALVAATSAFSMVALVTLRLVSLHPVDALLYGPFKINWLVDIGSSLVVLGAAGYYVTVLRQRT